MKLRFEMNDIIEKLGENSDFEKIFKITLCLGYFFFFLILVLVFVEPSHSSNILKDVPNFPSYLNEFENLFSFPDKGFNIFLIFSFVVLAINCISFILLFFFTRYSRNIWVCSLILMAIIGFMETSPSITYSVFDTINWLHSMVEGIVLFLIYFSPIKKKFL